MNYPEIPGWLFSIQKVIPKKEQPSIWKRNGKIMAPKKLFNIRDGTILKEKKKSSAASDEKEKEVPTLRKHPEIPPGPDPVARRPQVMEVGYQGRPRDVGPMEAGVATVARTLAPQLLSDGLHLTKMIIDERKTAVLNDKTQISTGYFLYRGQVDKIRFWNWTANWELVSSQAIDGRARRDALSAIGYAAGGKPMDVAQKPGWIKRHTTDRNWKEKAVQEGKVVVED